MEAISETSKEGSLVSTSETTPLLDDGRLMAKLSEMKGSLAASLATSSAVTGSSVTGPKMLESSSGIASSATLFENEHLKAELAWMKKKDHHIASSATASSATASSATRLENERLKAELARMKMKDNPIASSVRDGPKSSSVIASSATRLENDRLKAELARMKMKDNPIASSVRDGPKSSSVIASSATHLENERLKAELARMKMKDNPFASSVRDGPKPSSVTASSATHLENEQLKAELARVKEAAAASPLTSTATRVQNQELKEKLMLMKIKEEENLAMKKKLKFQKEQLEAACTRRLKEIQRIVSKAQEMDIAFLVDCTGSMDASIDLARSEVQKLVEGISEIYPKCKLRVAFVGYRDYDEDVDILDFTPVTEDDVGSYVSGMEDINAEGGDDTAEDVFTGLEQVAELSWESAGRLLVHIADAPCHGSEFHDLGSDGDSHLEGDKLGREVSSILRTLRDDCAITTYLFCHLNPSTRKMVSRFRALAHPHPDSPMPMPWIQEENLSELSALPEKIVQASLSAISQSLSTMARGDGGMRAKLAMKEVDPSIPDWAKISPKSGYQMRYSFCATLDELFHRIENHEPLDLEKFLDVRIQIAGKPFSADGAVRWPYFATTSSSPQIFVVKRFKDFLGADTKKTHRKERYFEQMEVQVVSSQLAEAFVKECKARAVVDARRVCFTNATVLCTGKGPTEMFYNMERLLSGSWIKYSSNAGYVNTPEYTATLQAFSHWTYCKSLGLLIVTDLQGVRLDESTNHSFFLSDPAIHCTNVLRFSKTNLGPEGFELFFKSHKCNAICVKLGLHGAPVAHSKRMMATMPMSVLSH